MKCLHKLLMAAACSVSFTVLSDEPTLYACNLPCVDSEVVANSVAMTLSIDDKFVIFDIARQRAKSYEVNQFVEAPGRLVMVAEQIDELPHELASATRSLSHLYFERANFVIDLPRNDLNGMYKPITSFKSLLNWPQQRDWVAVSLEVRKDVKDFALDYIEEMKSHVVNISSVIFHVTTVLSDGSTAKFKVYAHQHSGKQEVELEIQYVKGSARSFNDTLAGV